MLSIVDKDQLEPGCSVLLKHQRNTVVGILSDETDPMVSVMKVEKAPTESYADIGGLDEQVREIKEAVELPCFVERVLSLSIVLDFMDDTNSRNFF
jgi:26S proteasome regulatory subunit T2